MRFLHEFRERLTDAVHRHPLHIDEPLLGSLEQVGAGLWRTVQPVAVIPNDPLAEPVHVTLEGDEHGPWNNLLDTLRQLPGRYQSMRPDIDRVLHAADPRAAIGRLPRSHILSSVELWRDPHDDHPVIALEYALDASPEYAFVVRVENWKALDVVIAG